MVIAADGLHSVARSLVSADEAARRTSRGPGPPSRSSKVSEHDVAQTDVVVYVGPRCHFVQYPLRGGEMFNQVAVFESPTALRGEEDWGTPDGWTHASPGPASTVQEGHPADVAGPLVADV